MYNIFDASLGSQCYIISKLVNVESYIPILTIQQTCPPQLFCYGARARSFTFTTKLFWRVGLNISIGFIIPEMSILAHAFYRVNQNQSCLSILNKKLTRKISLLESETNAHVLRKIFWIKTAMK